MSGPWRSLATRLPDQQTVKSATQDVCVVLAANDFIVQKGVETEIANRVILYPLWRGHGTFVESVPCWALDPSLFSQYCQFDPERDFLHEFVKTLLEASANG